MPLADDCRYDIEPPRRVEFRSLRSTEISCEVIRVATSPERVDVTAHIPFSTWMTIVRDGAFHVDLDYEELGEPGADVEIELMLRPAFAFDLDDGDRLVTALLGDDRSELHETEAWILGSALQTVLDTASGERASIGFRTVWARPLV